MHRSLQSIQTRQIIQGSSWPATKEARYNHDGTSTLFILIALLDQFLRGGTVVWSCPLPAVAGGAGGFTVWAWACSASTGGPATLYFKP
jgi:hypothetical protein